MIIKNTSTVLILSLLLLFASCKENKHLAVDSGDVISKSDAKNSIPKNIDCKHVHWSHHEGEEGPDHWKNLCAGFLNCGGKAQSPINIAKSSVIIAKDMLSPKFKYGKSGVNIINNGHTIQFNIKGQNVVNLANKDYQLLQFHFHSLSEHTIDDKHYPLEIHFVHKHSENDYAVIGVMIKQGKENELLKRYLDKFPTTKGEYTADETIDLLKILPKNKSYYYYKGSLTTPPCSEIINWYVLKNPVEASKEQIEKFSRILNHNFRPTQPLNGRNVRLYVE